MAAGDKSSTAVEEAEKVDGPWGKYETDGLLEAWATLRRRRRQALGDMWVPEGQRLRGRRSRTLFPEDWRAVAAAVNGSRASSGFSNTRTIDQCKNRVHNLIARYKKELSVARPSQWQFFSVIDAVFAEERPHARPQRLTRAAAAMEARQGHPSNVAGGGAHEDEGSVSGSAAREREAGRARGRMRMPKRPRSATPTAGERVRGVRPRRGDSSLTSAAADAAVLMVTKSLHAITQILQQGCGLITKGIEADREWNDAATHGDGDAANL